MIRLGEATSTGVVAGFYELVTSSEDWLMKRVLAYAKDRDYVKYTSTLAEAWRISIAGLSEAILGALQNTNQPPELSPDEDYTTDPIAAFGMLEAQRHRARGVRLDMFLGLMKYYKQSYIDLVRQADFEPDYEEHCRLFIERCFNRLEIGYCMEWAKSSEGKLLTELQTTNRLLTNEKNKYLTIFESIQAPVILLDEENRVDNVNHAAAGLFEGLSIPGSTYYDQQPAKRTLPWLTEELATLDAGDELELGIERDLQTKLGIRRFQVKLKRMLDVSEKFSGTVVILNDITERAQAEERQILATQILELLNQSDDRSDKIRDILFMIKESTGFESVAIRLREGLDYPYYVAVGFPVEFVEAEKYLCARDRFGELIRDPDGCPILECMCGNIIRGRTDPSLSFFTQGGSFWTNSTTELLASTTEEDRQARTRNRCHGEGYESVALIPLQSEDEIIGLLQLNDRRRGRFTIGMINFFERIGASIGIALSRRRAEEVLRVNEQRLALAVEASGAGIYEHNVPIGPELYHNQRWANILGYELDELPSYDQFPDWLSAQVHPSDQARLGKAYSKFIEGRTPVHDVEVRMKHKSGQWIYVQNLSNAVERDERGRATRIVGVMLDITTRKQAEEELKRHTEELARSNAELEQFAYIASHDLQEPLRAISSYMQFLERRYAGELGEDADAFITRSVAAASRMRTMINDLLTLSRVGTQGKPFEMVDSSMAVKLAMANLQKAIEESGAVIICDSLPTVMADASQLVQLFQNLLGNAIKFRGERRPEIQIRVERRASSGESHEEGANWVFAVQDNGVGIDPRYAERIFLIFQRLHTRDEYPGTGIGLALCKKIVERHGGRIWVESEPDVGSTFFFTLSDDVLPLFDYGCRE